MSADAKPDKSKPKPKRSLAARARRLLGRLLLASPILFLVAWFVLTRSPLTTTLVRAQLGGVFDAEVRLASAAIGLDGRVIVSGLRVVAVPGDGEPPLPAEAALLLSVDRAELGLDWAAAMLGRADEALTFARMDGPEVRMSLPAGGGPLTIAALFAGDGGVSGGAIPALPRVALRDARVTLGEHDADAFTPLKELAFDFDLEPDGSGDATASLRGIGPDAAVLATGRVTDAGIAASISGLTIADFGPGSVPSAIRPLIESLDLAGELTEVALEAGWDGSLSVAAGLDRGAVTVPIDEDRAPRIGSVAGSIAASIDPGPGGGTTLSGTLHGRVFGQPATLRLDASATSGAAIAWFAFDDPIVVSEETELWAAMPPNLQRRFSNLFIDPVFRARAEVWVLRGGAGGREAGDPLGLVARSATAGATVPASSPVPEGHEDPSVFTPKRTEVRVAAEVLDGSLAYRGFPYRLASLTGRVAVAGEVLRLEGIRGINTEASEDAAAEIVCDGWIAPLDGAAQVKLDIAASGVTVEEPLLAALGERRPAAEYVIGPTVAGRGPIETSFTVGITRDFGVVSIWNERIGVEIVRGMIAPEIMPVPTDASGVALTIDRSELRIDEQTIRPLAGGSAVVSARASLRSRDRDDDGNSVLSGLWLTIDADDVPLWDANGSIGVLSAMRRSEQFKDMVDPERGIRLAEDAGASGLISVSIELGRDPTEAGAGDASGPDTSVRGMIDLQTGNIRTLDPLGRLSASDIRGTAVFDNRSIRVNASGSVRAVDDDVPAAFTIGYAAGEDAEGGSGFELSVAELGASWPVEGVLERFDRDGAAALRDARATIAPDGRLDATLTLDPSDPGDTAAVRLTAFDGSFELGGKRVPARTTGGAVTFEVGPDLIRARDLTAAIPANAAGAAPGSDEPTAMLRADGDWRLEPRVTVDGRSDDAAIRPLEIELRDGRFESALVDALIGVTISEGASETVAGLEPAGLFNVDVTATREPGSGQPSVTGTLTPRRLSLARETGRVGLTFTSGEVAFGPGGGSFGDIAADGRGWSGTASGGWDAGPGSFELWAAFDADASEPAAQALTLVPADVSRAFDELALEPGETLTLRDGRLAIRNGPGRDGSRRDGSGRDQTVFASGVLGVSGLSLVVGVPVTDVAGSVAIELWRRDDGPTRYLLGVSADAMKLAGVTLTDATMSIVSGDDPGAVTIPDITAGVHLGRLSGSAGVDGSGLFSADLSVSGARFAPLLEELRLAAGGGAASASDGIAGEGSDASPGADAASRGLLTARLNLSGQTGQPESLAGRGRLSISGGRVLSLPLVTNVVELASLQVPLGARLSDADADFFIEGDIVAIERLSVRSPRIEIIGAGVLDWPTREVDVRLGSRGVGRRVPLVMDTIERLRGELVTVSLRGPIGSPSPSAGFLPSTRNVLGLLTRTGGTEGGSRVDRLERETDAVAAKSARGLSPDEAIQPD